MRLYHKDKGVGHGKYLGREGTLRSLALSSAEEALDEIRLSLPHHVCRFIFNPDPNPVDTIRQGEWPILQVGFHYYSTGNSEYR